MEQEHILNTHIDQLNEWWESAEKGDPIEGDLFIIMVSQKEYIITPAMVDFLECDDSRILARAPKPKPAWHDALAVMARCSNAPEGHREPFIRSEATHDVWIAEAGYGRTENLRDVTPLIEAKVTDEMVERAIDAWVADEQRGDGYLGDAIRSILTAALGLENA